MIRPASAILVVSAIAVALVTVPNPRPTTIDDTGRNVYRLEWDTIHPGAIYYSSGAMLPGFVSVHFLRDVLRWVESMPSGTTLLCSRYQAEIAEPASLRVFAPGQFELFLRVCRRRRIRVIVNEWQPGSSAGSLALDPAPVNQ